MPELKTRHGHSVREVARAALLSVALSLALGMVFQLTLQLDQSLAREKQRSLVADKALAVATQLENELNADVYLANGLAALVVAVPNLADASIEAALKVLHSTSPNLRNIAMAPGNRISHVYPRQGNERALGLYYPESPEQWGKVKEAMERKSTVLAGPLPLKQGGTGVVSRTPVFMSDGRYWGVLSLVVDADQLFERTRLKAEKLGLTIGLRGKDGMGSAGEVFLGSPQLFGGDAVLLSIHVPGGSWQLAAQPLDQADHTTGGVPWWQRAMGWSGCAVIGVLFFLYLRGRHRVNSSERKLRAILETTPDGVIVIDGKGVVEVFNPGAEEMFGYLGQDVVGQHVNMLMTPDDASRHDGYVAHAHQSRTREMAQGREIHGRRKDGSVFPIEVKIGGVEIDGRTVHVGILRDITERQLAQQKLFEMATQDELTKVANRRSMVDFLQVHLALAIRHQRALSVLMIDADHFKRINDQHGHDAGDKVLICLAELATACLRKSDKFGRLGGEEFLAVLPETPPEQAHVLAQRLVDRMAAMPVSIGVQATIRFTVSIGVAHVLRESDSLEDLLKRADVALYQAKAQGRNRVVMG